MLLAVDVGNTNTVMGVLAGTESAEPGRVLADWRITTPYRQTAD